MARFILGTLFFMAVVAHAQTSAKTSTDTSTALGTCQAIVASAKDKDYEGIRRYSTGLPGPSAQKNKEFARVEEKFYGYFVDLTCGKEIVAEDRAVIETDAKESKRLIPFIKVKDQWKFDAATYRSFYKTDEHHTQKKM